MATEALCLMVAVFCSERTKRKRKKRLWTRSRTTQRGYYGLSVLQMEPEDDDGGPLRDLLGMDVEDFSYLLAKVEPLIHKTDTKMRRAISAKQRLLVTLRFLATGESFRSLSSQHGIGRTTISQIVMETCEALYNALKEEYFRTPTTEAEWRDVASAFHEKWRFPHCLGAIDGKHLYIQPPAHSGGAYHGCKSRVSVVLMAVADANYKFIYASVGTQGRVFDQSDLCAAMDRGLLNLPYPEPLPDTNVSIPYAFIGDEEFPLRTDVMKPYPHQDLDHGERVFNYRLSRARRTVENAFGILANRLRVFRTSIALEPDKVATVALAALTLHNFLGERASKAYAPPAFVDSEDEGHALVRGAWRRDGELASVAVSGARSATAAAAAAEEQRDQLRAYFLSPAGSVPWQENMI